MPFKPGQSGNPKGRPRRTDSEQALRERIRKAAPRVIDALLAAAEAGDVTAGKALLGYVMPPYKAVDRPVSVPMPDDMSDLNAATNADLKALATGALTPDQAASVAATIASLARTLEYAELESRLSHLEDLLNATRTPTNG